MANQGPAGEIARGAGAVHARFAADRCASGSDKRILVDSALHTLKSVAFSENFDSRPRPQPDGIVRDNAASNLVHNA